MSDDAAIALNRKALTRWLKDNPFDAAGVEERRGDGFYVDKGGHVRACRTDARVDRPQSSDLARWVAALRKAIVENTGYGEYSFDDLERAIAEIEAWDSPPDSA